MRLPAEHVHFGWDRAVPPQATIAPGETITLRTLDASCGQLTTGSTSEDLAGVDFGRANPVTGPIEVAGARPGDLLAVTIEHISVAGWGWTANIPGFGLLADEFPEPHLAISRIGADTIELPFGPSVPVVPMIGTIGVAPPEPGPHPIVPPGPRGGNLDIRHLTSGSTLFLPIGVDGALLSVGDAHAAQGDGEVCGTGVETASETTLRVELIRDRPIRFPRYLTDPRSDRTGPAMATTGVGPDLMAAARDAVREMIDELGARTGLAPVEAYLLASLVGDLRISEVVDAPNWVVSFAVPLGLL